MKKMTAFLGVILAAAGAASTPHLAQDAYAGLALAGEVTGLERIQADIVADAPNQFVHVLGLEWPLSYLGSGNVTLKVNPSTAFQVNPSPSLPNVFNVKLVSTTGLTTPFGSVLPISVEVFGRGGGGGQASDEIGVQFVADNGSAIDLTALGRDPSVRDLRIEATPGDHVQQIRIHGSQVYFKRLPGYGTEAVKVRLSFSYQGTPYAYTADLPIKDDGMLAGTLNFVALDPVSPSEYAGSSQTYSNVSDAWEAADFYKAYIENLVLAACRNEIEYGYDEYDRCEAAAIKKGYKKGEFEVLSATRQSCSAADVPYIEVPESTCNFHAYKQSAYCFESRLPRAIESYSMNNRIDCSISYLKRK